MISKLIAIMFLSRDEAHKEHLRTDSYARHMALGDFYDAIIDNADTIAETYQGRNGIIGDIPSLEMGNSTDIIETLKRHMDAIEQIRYSAVDRNDTPLQNLIDEAVATYLRTLYKLRRFK